MTEPHTFTEKERAHRANLLAFAIEANHLDKVEFDLDALRQIGASLKTALAAARPIVEEEALDAAAKRSVEEPSL